MARRLHPHDGRKIARSLEVFRQTGIPHSTFLSQQRAAEQNGPLFRKLSLTTCLCFWLHSDRDVLDRRLDARVDTMLARGLLGECRHFAQRAPGAPGLARGLGQCIGFKELLPYVRQYPEAPAMGEAEPEAGAELLLSCLERMKGVTRRYARKQTAWVRGRIVKRRHSTVLLAATGFVSAVMEGEGGR